MKKLILFFFAVNFILSGCGASGPYYQDLQTSITEVKTDSARIFVLRTTETTLYMGRSAPIDVNGEKAGSCPAGGYLYIDVAIEKIRLSTETLDSPGECVHTFTPKPEETYYFEILPRDESHYAGFAGGLFGGFIGGKVAQTFESIGNDCSGMFALQPIEKDEAEQKLQYLKCANN